MTDTFFRRVWRWHFWAGLLAAPVLLVVAVTAAVYTFRDEIDEASRPDLHFVIPDGEPKPADDLLSAVAATHPDTTPTRITFPADPRRSVTVQTADDRAVFVNPYSAEVRGDRPAKSPFFAAVLTLHRNLFAGTVGRVAVELTTSWTVVLLVSGVTLWWPKRWSQVWGVWLPRLWGPKYRVLRDLHTVAGAWLAPVAAVLAVTGLFFGVVWLWGYNAVTGGQGDFPAAMGVSAKAEPNSGAVPVETAVATARERWPGAALTVQLPKTATDPYGVTARGDGGRVIGVLAVDPHTGAVLGESRAEELPPLQQLRLWVFPVHTGAVGGLPTKALAVLACGGLAGLAVSGVWMWLVRRPAGRWGFPRASTAAVPKAAVAVTLLLAVLFPTVGFSLVIVLFGGWAVARLRRPRRSSPEPQPAGVP